MNISRRDFIAIGAAALASRSAFAQDEGGLVVHEWGVVSIAYGSSVWGNARSAGAKAAKGGEVAPDLPKFVATWEDHVKEQINDWRCQPVDKPVVYFYSPKAMDVSVEVAVPTGRPKAWWPEVTAFQPGFEGRPMRGLEKLDEDDIDPKLAKIKPVNGLLRWEKLSLDPGVKEFPKADGWWNLARGVDATPFTFVEPKELRYGLRRVSRLGRKEPRAEKFLFYDAMLPVDPKIALEWTKAGDVSVTNHGGGPLGAVIALRVKDGKCASATHGALAKGASVTLTPAGGVPALAAALVKAGLYEKEAASIVEIWKEEFFQVDGVRVLAILPRALYDALLPITIKPEPKELARVLVAHVECLDVELQEKVEAAIAKFSSDSIEEREAAAQTIKRLGALAEHQVRRAAEQAKDEEVKSRLLELLKR
jgi:hypothetical protein